MDAILLLEDGRSFRGRSLGAVGLTFGELVFNTSMMGYQEILTDPSYRGQIVTMTTPLIGNYGVNDSDMESARPALAGFVVRYASEQYSSWRANNSLASSMREHGVVGIRDIDTRAVTRHIRERGAMRAAIASGDWMKGDILKAVRAYPPLEGRDLVREVTCGSVSVVPAADGAKARVVAYDFGMKRSIVRALCRAGCQVTIVPAATSAEQVLERAPDGVVLSNGPGDPAGVPYAMEAARKLLGKVPILGICLGHQILGLACGGRTFKLKFGHHGGNHPVRDQRTGEVLITVQNHGFAVDPESLAGTGVEVTHVNLNDGTVEGLRSEELGVQAVQFHPEAAPGPRDAIRIFEEFARRLTA